MCDAPPAVLAPPPAPAVAVFIGEKAGWRGAMPPLPPASSAVRAMSQPRSLHDTKTRGCSSSSESE